MECTTLQEDVLYSQNTSKLTPESIAAIQNTVQRSQPVGIVAGLYDEALTITDVSGFFLKNLGYEYEDFCRVTGCSLRALFYGENQSFLAPERWPLITADGDGQLLTKDGVPIFARLYKMDSTNSDGAPIWILSAQMDWVRQNLHLVNSVMRSGIWYIDCDHAGSPTGVVYSHEFRRMLGYHDVLDFPNTLDAWSALIHPDDRGPVLAALDRSLSDRTGASPYDVEYRMRLPDGHYEWFRDSAEASRRLNGTIRRFVGVFVNVDKEKRAELLVKKSEAFHRAYTESNLCEYYVDLQTDHFDPLKEAPSFLSAFEQPSWDALVCSYRDRFIAPADRDAVAMIFDRSYITERFRQKRPELSFECRLQLNGEERWVRNVVMPGETTGDPRYAIVFIRDITDSKKEAAQIAALTQQNKAMDMLLQSTVKLVDRYFLCNLSTDEYTFYNMLSAASRPSSGCYHDLVAYFLAQFQPIGGERTLEENLSPAHLRQQLRTPDDIYRFEYSTKDETQFKTMAILPVSWKDGVVEQALFVAQDVTQEKKTEIASRKALKDAYDAANRANRAKTEFLSNMSHDIRTPMNAIVGMTAIAGANINNPERVADCLGKITQSSHHLLGLINEVLDMSRIESGKVVLNEEAFNLAELVDDLIGINKGNIAAHGHSLDVHLHKLEHEDVYGDSLRIQQVITNILSNAIKYTPDGGHIVFSIAEQPTHSPGVGCYQFTVKDNGIGMTPEFQKILFEPFTRADDKRTTKIQGTGLGMAIAQNTVNMMNGTIDVESELGKGSKFTVTIFLKLQDRSTEQIDELAHLPVLVVDDDVLCCESTVEMLQEVGIDGEWTTSGEEAVARAAARHEAHNDYFAVLVDWKMPGMNGVELTRCIRQKLGKALPIIVLTAYDYTDIENEARTAGVNDFITKPLFRSRLTAALKNLVAGKPNAADRNELDELARCDYTGKRILLVEDNELNREIAKEIIGMTGVSIECAENGREAVEKFTAAPVGYYDLIFMDIQMPLMNGYETTAAIRAQTLHGGQTIPIVAMTANAFAEDVVLSRNAGMNDHIAKPLDLNKLNDVLQQWL